MRISTISIGALMLVAAPAFAQDATTADTPSADTTPAPAEESKPAITFTGGAVLTSDYRFRGVTQSNEEAAVQGTLNVNTAFGIYGGVWASTINGERAYDQRKATLLGLPADTRVGHTPALAGYGNEEVDLYVGYTKGFGAVTFDGGLLYYYYPAGYKNQNTDFFEPYASLSAAVGPVSAKVGAAYAWKGQDGLRGFDVKQSITEAGDNIYAYGELGVGVPTTPITLKGHLGYSKGALGSLNNPLLAADNDYFDWSATAEFVGGPFKVGVTYVDTDIKNTHAYNGLIDGQGFAQSFGRGSTVLGYVGVSF